MHCNTLCCINLTISASANVFWHEPHVNISCTAPGSVDSESAVNKRKINVSVKPSTGLFNTIIKYVFIIKEEEKKLNKYAKICANWPCYYYIHIFCETIVKV